MIYVPNEKRYEGIEYRRCGDSGLSLPPISLGAWQNFGGESLTSFSLVLSLDASLAAIRKEVDTILHANPLWNGGKWEVMISELGEMSMVVRITLGAANPEIGFQLRSQVQEHILDYLNEFKKGFRSLIGAVADQRPPTEGAEPINSQKLEPKASASREA